MKRSELSKFIKEEIFTTLEEATIETSPQNLSKVKSQAKDDDVIKVVETNIGLADLEERGYEAGEKAAYTYGTLLGKLKNRPDKLAYNKGFMQGVKDELGSSLSEDLNEDEDDDVDAKAIKAAKGARGKHKKLDIALKSLKSITAEMKSLAREYSKADGVEKEKIKDKLKKKTPIKKELEAMVAKLEKNVI